LGQFGPHVLALGKIPDWYQNKTGNDVENYKGMMKRFFWPKFIYFSEKSLELQLQQMRLGDERRRHEEEDI